MKETKYINFVLSKDPSRKTNDWMMYNKMNHSFIGAIHWFAPWRKYCFFPNTSTTWDINCLSEIINFIDEQMELRKKS